MKSRFDFGNIKENMNIIGDANIVPVSSDNFMVIL